MATDSTLRDQRMAAAHVANARRLDRATDLWLTAVSEDELASQIGHLLDTLGTARCDSATCPRVDQHPAHN